MVSTFGLFVRFSFRINDLNHQSMVFGQAVPEHVFQGSAISDINVANFTSESFHDFSLAFEKFKSKQFSIVLKCCLHP